jgi:hypothetical protein
MSKRCRADIRGKRHGITRSEERSIFVSELSLRSSRLTREEKQHRIAGVGADRESATATAWRTVMDAARLFAEPSRATNPLVDALADYVVDA